MCGVSVFALFKVSELIVYVLNVYCFDLAHKHKTILQQHFRHARVCEVNHSPNYYIIILYKIMAIRILTHSLKQYSGPLYVSSVS